MPKRCPFCSYSEVKLQSVGNSCRIICQICYAMGPIIDIGDQFDDEESKKIAWIRWNMRPLYNDNENPTEEDLENGNSSS